MQLYVQVYVTGPGVSVCHARLSAQLLHSQPSALSEKISEVQVFMERWLMMVRALYRHQEIRAGNPRYQTIGARAAAAPWAPALS